MKKEKLQCDTAREILIVEFLKKNGFSPQRENQKEAWYLSPIRDESGKTDESDHLITIQIDHP